MSCGPHSPPLLIPYLPLTQEIAELSAGSAVAQQPLLTSSFPASSPWEEKPLQQAGQHPSLQVGD